MSSLTGDLMWGNFFDNLAALFFTFSCYNIVLAESYYFKQCELNNEINANYIINIEF